MPKAVILVELDIPEDVPGPAPFEPVVQSLRESLEGGQAASYVTHVHVGIKECAEEIMAVVKRWD